MADPRYSLFAARAVFDPRLTATDVRVLAALGTYTNKQGWCNPKQATVAIRVGVSRTTVTASMKRLVETGYLEIKHQVIAGRGQCASNYRVILDLDPMSAWTTPGADVSEDDTPMSAQTTGGVVPVGHPPSNQDDTQKEHSQENIPTAVAVAPARDFKAMIKEAQSRAGDACNLTSGFVHHVADLRRLVDGGCDWEMDVLPAIDAVSAGIIARRKPRMNSWAHPALIEAATQLRDRRIAGLPDSQPGAASAPRFESPTATVQRLAREGRI